METVPLRVGTWLEIGRAGRLGAARFLVRRVFHGRDEVSEQHLSRRRLDAVRVPMQIIEICREEAVLDGLDERVCISVLAVPLPIYVRIQSYG